MTAKERTRVLCECDKHPSLKCYKEHGCRCVKCRALKTERRREERHRATLRKGGTPKEPEPRTPPRELPPGEIAKLLKLAAGTR